MNNFEMAKVFIEEFGEEILAKYGLDVGGCILSRRLVYDDGSYPGFVRIHYRMCVNGVKADLISSDHFYNPETPDDDTIELTFELIGGLKWNVKLRLLKAGLLSEPDYGGKDWVASEDDFD